MSTGSSQSVRAGSTSSRGNSSTTTSGFRSRTGRSNSKPSVTSTGSRDIDIVCAISEARGISPTIGLAFVNLSTSEAVLCQLSDTQTYARTCHKIKAFGPSDILYSSKTEDSKLVSILNENLSNSENKELTTPIDRKFWSESAGYDYLQQLAFPDDLESLKLAVAGNFYAICSFAAAISYIDLSIRVTFISHTLRIRFEPSEGVMMLDLSTIKTLELVQNLHNAKSKDCLFGLLNQTLTKMGSRMLKSNILQPSTDETKIKQRYDAVSELSTKEAIFFPVREALKLNVDTDKVLTALVIVHEHRDFAHMEQSVNHVLMLKTFIDDILPLWQALTGVESQELQNIRNLCNPENYVEVQELIKYAINEDVHFANQSTELRNQRVFAIKAGVNGFLDVARHAYKEINEDVNKMVDSLNAEFEVTIDLKFDPSRQYYLRVKEIEFDDRPLPTAFINVFHNKDRIEFQTMDLVKTNQKLKDAHNEVIAMSNNSIQGLIVQVRSKIHALFKISEAIAMLDMLASFAQMVTTQDYIEPELLTTLALKSGRHPILEKIQRSTFIANDVYASEQHRFQIITGCNMSGKSTYIRTIALMTIMTQIGCFVPAEYASFPIMHQLFARVSTDDSIEANVSTFASEMREIAFILHNIEPQSLVIVDELGRGTSTTDGLVIAIAIAEALIESKAFVWFVTHFRDLPRILAERAGVVNLHLAVDIAPDFSSMKMKYKISEGCEEQKYYGLALASLMNLPQKVLDIASEVSQALNARNEARKHNVKTLAVAKRRKLVLKLREQLMQAKESDVDDEALRTWLKRLQEEFIIRMSVIDGEIISAEPDSSSSQLRLVESATTEHISTDPSVTYTSIETNEGHGSLESKAMSSPPTGRAVFATHTPLLTKTNHSSKYHELVDDAIED